MVDYRKFLGKSETVVAPWWGGRSIDVSGRQLRLSAAPAKAGWYEFELKGRVAAVKQPCDAPPLDKLPRVRGFSWRDRLVGDGARAEVMHLLPEEEAPRFSPITARRWHGGALIYEGLEFESEAESTVREALAKGEGLKNVSGVAAPLRAAFAFALVEQTARRMNVPVAPSEIRAHLSRIADEGTPGAEAVIRALMAEREETEREMRELRARIAAAQVREDLRAAREARAAEDLYRQQAELLSRDDLARARAARGDRPPRGRSIEDMAWDALEKAGAQFESCRHLGRNQLEVIFGFMDERFISIVDATTLQVIDSGICLGHPPRDDLVTLDSLCGVIREAIETGRLVILRAP